MRSSTSPASRRQFASSMPSSTRGRSGGAGDKNDMAQLASATFSADELHRVHEPASEGGPIPPHRPAAAKTKLARLTQWPPPPPPQKQPEKNKKEKKLLHSKADTTDAIAAHGVGAQATALDKTVVAAAGADGTFPSLASDPLFPFDVYPPTVIFDNFTANTTYTATLELKNRTSFNKHVRVDRPNACTAFELTATRGAESSSKVAPGLSVTYTVVFTPTSSIKDYEADLVVRTEDDELLIVPVRAYASRECLHLPASLVLKDAPMKGSSTTPLFLRNASERSCVWRAVVFDPSGTQTCTEAYDAAAAAQMDSFPLSSCFSITPHNGVVEPLCAAEGHAVTVAPVTLHFRPDPRLAAACTCHGLLRFFLGPEGDMVQDVQLSARAVELNGIVLEEGEVTLADTYVTTERQTVVRVRNNSDETLFFAWKNSFRAGASEMTEKSDSVDEGDGAYGEGGKKHRRPTRPTAAGTHMLLPGNDGHRMINGGLTMEDGVTQPPLPLQHTLSDLSNLYEMDESFQIHPLSGVLYGRGVREFTITFNPHLAVPYESVAYLDVTGSAECLPLLMRGHGVGPQCKLEYSRLDIGDVYLNAVHEYFIMMENTSAIECQFVIMPPVAFAGAPPPTKESGTPGVDFASKFHFTPSHGSLAPGESVKLKIELKSDRIGSFAETFHVHMQGAVEEVPLLLKGRVLGPHFQCDVDELDFGNVSYNMEHHRTMNIENTSPIPMHYTLHLPEDCVYASDFVITPAKGVIAPRATEVVQVLFHSLTVGDYETALQVEVADVGDVLDTIPLKATCMVPTLHSSTTELTYGGVFVGYPTTLNVAISNETALTGMFNLLLLNGDALTDAVIVELPVSIEHDDGVHWIAPHQTLQLPVTLTALKPGRLHFSLALNVLGRELSEPMAPPLTILVSAVASGPHVELQPSNIQFGVLDVLTEEVRELTLKNTSPVPAPFSLVFDRFGTVPHSAHSPGVGSGGYNVGSTDGPLAESTLPFPRVPVFSVEPAQGILEPHSSFTVRVRAKPDDAISFVDTLRLRRRLSLMPEIGGRHNDSDSNSSADTASSETEVTVSVKVTGVGVPIIADRPLESIELGDVLTTVPVAETVTLHNYGRREQEMQWQNTRGTKVKDGELPITFTYKPERASIPAGGSALFMLCGSSSEGGTRTDTFTLKQSGTFKEVLRSTVKATFVAPTLSCSSRAIAFEYANSTSTTAATAVAPLLVKSLTMKNITSKTLVITLRIKAGGAPATATFSKIGSAAAPLPKVGTPFSLEGSTTISLSSGESYVVGVRCNPLYRGDYTSHTAKAKLQLSFANHERKEFVSLSAVLRFPSVVLNPSPAVDFGTVLNHTEQRRSIELYNPSHDLPATFCWSFRPHGSATAGQAEDAAFAAAAAAVGPTTDAKGSADGAAEASFRSKSVEALSASNAKEHGFDIVPFSGTLLPGEKKVVEVAYQGADMGAALATAVCRIEGGPTYTIDLRAAANVVQAHCDKTHIDFGRLPYYESDSKVVTLTNTTQVHVPWQVDLSRVRHPECLKVSPMSGVLRDKARLQITFLPKVPDVFEETIWVCIGHLDPRPIHLSGSGYMSRVAIATNTTAAAQASGAAGGGAGQSTVQIYRAPFGAFTEALQDVGSHLASTPSAKLAGLSLSSSSNVVAPAELPAMLQKDWPILEAERRAFCRAIREGLGAVIDTAEVLEKPPLFLAPRTMPRSSAAAQRIKGSSTTKLVVARYIVDFGHLTRHDVRKTKLFITNPSSEGVNVVLDAKELANLPVSVEPMKGIKVAAFETTTIELTMDATMLESMVPHGENTHEFTLDIKNGPAVVVECRCYVATPALRAKEKEMDFGAVLLGEVKVLPLVLTNLEAVACPWRVTCKMLNEGEATHRNRFSSKAETREDDVRRVGSANSDERGAMYNAGNSVVANGSEETAGSPMPEFWVKQDRGVVPASGTVTIDVYYAPRAIRAKSGANSVAVVSAAQLKFRCGTGAASSFLAVKLSGSGRYYNLSLSTEQLRLPPSRPHQVLQESVTITNNEDHAVEIYDIELDARHANEVSMLRCALVGAVGHEVLLPHIHAGGHLPETLLDSVFSRLHAESDALVEVQQVSVDAPASARASDNADADGAAGRNAGGNKAGLKARGSIAASSQAAAGARGSARGNRKESRRTSSKSAAGDAVTHQAGGASANGDGSGNNNNSAESNSGGPPSLLMLVGPPRSGKTSVAQQWLSKGDGKTVLVDIDALIRAEAECDDTANAAVARCLLTRAAGVDEAAEVVCPAAAPAWDSTLAGAKATEASVSCEACVPTLIRDLLLSFFSNSISAEKANATAVIKATTALSDAAQATTASSPKKSSNMLATLRFVVDGLTCSVLANQWTIYELICSVCATLHISVHVVSLHVSTPMSNVRAARALAAHHAERVAAASLTPLGEAAYEALSKDDREDYNRRLKHMNDCRRDLQVIQQELKNWIEKLPHVSVQEEMEEGFRQQQAAAALEATMRPTKGAKAAPATQVVEDKSAELRESEWRALNDAAQFSAWYKRFLLKYGLPPSNTEEKTAGAAGATVSLPIRQTGNAKGAAASAAGAAAGGAGAAAHEVKTGWSQVHRVNTESSEPATVAEDIAHQLALQGGSVRDSADALVHGNADLKPAPGVTPAVSPKTEATSALSAVVSTAGHGQWGESSEGLESQVGEWFYLNEARLRCWTAEATLGARRCSVSASSPGGEDMSKEGRAASAESAAADHPGSASNGIAKVGNTSAEDKPSRYVRFFSTVEREVAPPKKAASSKKSVPAIVMQKEEITRWMLPAHSSVVLTLEFCSDHVGKFVERCIFGVTGSLQQLCLMVTAVVALPDISRDVKDIFPVVKPRIGAGGAARRMPKVYISSKKLFDFGALLIPPPPSAKGHRRSGLNSSSATGTSDRASSSAGPAGRPTSAEQTVANTSAHVNTQFEETLSFVNREPATADVTLSFTNDKEKTFTVTPSSFTLQPGATQRVQLRATPEKAGDLVNTLVATIKDNPVPWKAEVMCTGARPTLSVNGVKDSLEADFGRLVLRRSLSKSFTLANEGSVPLFWRMALVQEVSTRGERGGGGGGGGSAATAASNALLASAASQLPAELQCSTMEGVLEENEMQTLEMTFAPTHPCLHNRVINFLVSEVGQPQAVYETVPLTVKAEGYDVVVEWTRELQFGVLHVGEEKREPIRIMNKCPYDIGYQLRMPKRLQKSLTISAPSGTLRGMMGHKDAAIATIDVVARLDKEGELPAKLSTIEVAFFDVEKQELLYPLQTIPVYGEAWYTKYAVYPPSVSFGSSLVGQPRESTFQLTNTGRFPIDFSLFNFRDTAAAAGSATAGSVAVGGATTTAAQGADAAANATGGADNALITQKSFKSLKGIEAEFVIGAFTCRPSQGVVPVGGTQVITVSTVPSQQNRTHETIGVRVAQCGPELERYGTSVEVSAHPAAPSIAANLTSNADVETIFEEQRVVYRLDQLPKGVRAYSTEERIFSFGTVLVGQRCEERFRIANSSPLTCSVVVQLEGSNAAGNGGGGGAYMADGGLRAAAGNTGGGGGGNAGDAARPDGFDLAVEGKGAAFLTQSKASAVKFTLLPFESRFVTVAFTPTALSRLQAQLVATVDNSATLSEERVEIGQQLRFGLRGEGTLPTVDLVLPRLYTSPDVGRSWPSVSGTVEHLRGSDISAASDKKKSARRRQIGVGLMSATNVHTEGTPAGAGTAEVLELPITRVGASSQRSFAIRNTGCVQAQLRLDLVSDSTAGDEPTGSSAFLSLNASSVKSSQLNDPTEMRRTLDVVVPVGESKAVDVTYTPSQVEATTTRLRLALAHNPFEDKEIHVLARSFKNSITFEGIDPASADYVDVGDCYLGVDKTCTFSARNNTESLVRYVWEMSESVRITPSTGHLPAGATRTFTATVCSQMEGLGQRAPCALHAQSILVHPVNAATGAMAGMRTTTATTAAAMPSSTNSDWDNSLQSPKWVLREDDADVHPSAAAYLSTPAAMMGRRNLKQIMEAVPEPAYSVVDEVDVTQPLTMGYRCSVPTYQCQLVSTAAGASDLSAAASTSSTTVTKDLKAVSFPHTYLLQSRVSVVRIVNTGSVALPYSCRISANGFSSNEKETSSDPAASAVELQATVPPWRAGQVSTAAASGEMDDTPNGELLAEPHHTADFSVTSPSWALTDTGPSDVHVVAVGSHVDLNVEFTPRTVGLLVAGLLLYFPHSVPQEVQVPLQGVSECPLVHFRVPPPSSSVVAKALQRGAGGHSPPPAPTAGGQQRQEKSDPIVVEFLARGLHTKATVSFPVVNPTTGPYSYEWVEESGSAASAAGGSVGAGAVGAAGAGAVSGSAMSPFRCLSPSGVIEAGRSVEASFEFFADALGARSSSWTFRIPGRATIPFRFVGNVVEPNMYFHASKVDFENVQVGTRVERTVILENCDDVPFSFSWDKLSLDGMSTFLSVKPLRGTVAPWERLPILLSFAPQEEMEYNAPLRCVVKKSSVPLTINVKGVGICVHDTLQVEMAGAAENASSEIISVLRGQQLKLDLDRVQVNSTAARRFVLRNTGTYLFHYHIDTPMNPCMHIDNTEGAVEAGQSAVIMMQYTPVAEETLKQYRLIFRIEGRVAYKVCVRAVAYLPRLRLSFDRYDFGAHFVAAYNNALSISLAEAASAELPRDLLQDQLMGCVSQELQLTNVESETISVECGMAAQNTWCKLDCTSLVVRPNETARLKLTFAPTEVRGYEDALELCLNKVHTTRLQITGEGVAPRVEVANPFAKFGCVRVGESRSVEVKLQCCSKISTPVSFARAVDDDLRNKGVSVVFPGQSSALSSMLVLKPKEIVLISIVFAPSHRMSEFSREIKMLVSGIELPFVSVNGSCADAEVHLDTSHLEFRDVVIGASATRKVFILNSGDVPQKFSWMNSLHQFKSGGEWSITPSKGFLRAHTEVVCEVRYSPKPRNKGKASSTASSSQSPTIAAVAQPMIAAAAATEPPRIFKLELDSAPPLSLRVDANAVTRPAATETVQFSCRARESDTKTIEVENTTNQLWSAEPVVDNALWSCPSMVTLKPLAKTTVAVTYNPARPTLISKSAVTPRSNAPAAAAVSAPEGNEKRRQSTMAAVLPQHQKDKGFFFIPLPDGTGRCVALEGTAEAAGPAGPLQLYDTVVHVSLPLRFQVHNFSSSATMFFVKEVEWTSGPVVESGESGTQIALRVHESESESSAPKKGGGVASRPTGGVGGQGASKLDPKKARLARAASVANVASGAMRGAIEVSPNASKEFVLTVTPLREGTFRGVVRFLAYDKNGAPATEDGLQQFYEVEVKAQPAPIAAPTVVELRAAIRDLASFNIPLTNPLTKPVEFSFKSSAVDGSWPSAVASSSAIANSLEGLSLPLPVVVPAQSHAKAAVTYFPLLCKKTPATVQCAVTSPDLGTSDIYVLRLVTATDTVAPERPTLVECPLGQHVSFSLRFTHYCKSNTEFVIRLGGEVLGKTLSSFSRVGGGGGGQGATVKVSGCPAAAIAGGSNTASRSLAPKGQEVVVEFNYEPSDLGEERETIEFVSPVAGTYIFPIVATCTAPQRQGPFSSRAGQNLQLPFKNVFHEPVNISVASDSAAFAPIKKTEVVPAHKTTNVVLQCKADEDRDVVRGRVSITCTPPGKSAQQAVEWLYYVEMMGVAERSGTAKQGGRKK
ncbi:hypothetical protein ABL78_4778 [Leptomonas seymouri]|uniref:Abnormal spindle-like microcephaly-associated protein ASH domain-containing protein n=1 Tax=Leptomonas seymouri TaxID=5684 RepID=A0A0N0P581_LEPSE|nr:hypothetical protein ABL78_4778 [Leptomonas seymouri]|eukprot:KPI86156.1 hypothetical protein ABL78_4778 [Leptomonas seymouri]